MPANAASRVVLADLAGHARRALAGLLEGLHAVTLVAEVADRDEIAAALRRCAADVLVIDDRLLRNHDRLLTSVGADRAAIRVIVLGVDDDPAFSARARRLGAEAWVAKDRAGDELPPLLGD